MLSENRLTSQILTIYVSTDLLFELFTFPTFLVALDLVDGPGRWRSCVRFAAVVVPSLALFAAGLVWLVRPVEQWLAAERTVSPEIIARAGARLHRLPLYTSIAWGLECFVVYAVLVAEVDAWRAAT